MEAAPTRRKPGPAPGTPTHGGAGRKPAPAQSLADAVLLARWQLFPHAHRPTTKAMAALRLIAMRGLGKSVLTFMKDQTLWLLGHRMCIVSLTAKNPPGRRNDQCQTDGECC